MSESYHQLEAKIQYMVQEIQLSPEIRNIVRLGLDLKPIISCKK